MYLFWAFIEALGLIGYLHSDGGVSWQRKRYDPIGWRDAVFLAQLYYLDANTKYWRVLSRSHWLWGVRWGEWYMIMLFVCCQMWAFLVLTRVLSSRCCADSPNKQCVCNCTVSKSIISNVFTLGYHCGHFIDWIPWFFWWHVLTAGSASSSQSCLYWARALLNSLSDTRVSTKRNSSLGNDNLPSVGWKFLLKTVWWPPNWSTTIPILASHEVETPPTPPKPIHMVSGAMLVEGYRMRQQSAVVVSEYLPSFETTQKTSTRDDLLCFYSPFYRRPLWNGLNLLVISMDKYRGQWLWEKWQSTVAGTDLPAWNGAKSPNCSTTVPILASHEVETPPTSHKSIHMVSGVMLVKG
jgi:hypothetical protein